MKSEINLILEWAEDGSYFASKFHKHYTGFTSFRKSKQLVRKTLLPFIIIRQTNNLLHFGQIYVTQNPFHQFDAIAMAHIIVCLRIRFPHATQSNRNQSHCVR